MKKKIFVIIFILIGILLIAYPIISGIALMRSQSTVITSYKSHTKDLTDTEKAETLEKAAKYNEELDKDSYINLSLNESDYENIENNGYINVLDIGDVMGYIIIPKIDVNLPIYHGVSYEVLQVGVGHIESSSLPVGGESTHAVLAGHNGLARGKIFDDLNKLEIGDAFYINIMDNTLKYEVDNIAIVEPDDDRSIKIEEGKDYVTLVTCTPYVINTHRLLVRGTRVEMAPGELENDFTENGSFYTKLSKNYIYTIIIGIILLIIIIPLIIFLNGKNKDEGKKYR